MSLGLSILIAIGAVIVAVLFSLGEWFLLETITKKLGVKKTALIVGVPLGLGTVIMLAWIFYSAK